MQTGCSRSSGVAANVVDHGLHGLHEKLLVDPEVHFLALLPALQHARVAQDLEVMRHRGAAEGGNLHDLADVQALATLEREQDALPVLVAERRVDLRDGAPLPGDGAHVVAIHNHKFSYMVMMMSR